MDRWKRRPLPRGGKARQQKQHDKAQRRVAAKEQRASSAPRPEDNELALAGMYREPQAVLA